MSNVSEVEVEAHLPLAIAGDALLSLASAGRAIAGEALLPL